MPSYKSLSSCLLASVFLAGTLSAADWPQWGGSPQRNNAPDAKNIPHQWNVGKFDRKTGDWLGESAENILFVAKLGSQSYGTPVVCGGKIYCTTNNGAGYLERYPAEVDLGCLLCFAQSDGRFLWQLSREKLASGGETDRDFDWPLQGICSMPLVEGDRLWIVTNRGEVACVDTEGFADDENDGPYRSETRTAADEADVVWYFDMMARLGIRQHNMCSCSVTAAGDLLLVNTGNGVDASEEKVPAPQAPSFIALDKHTGELLWADNSPGENILHGQWSSPAFAVLGGVPQAIFPGADGWVYSFLAEKSEDGKPKLLWKFDCNPKRSIWEGSGMGERSNIIATPVVRDGWVYIATGQDPEHGEWQGHLWCIDPTRRGDVSPELVFDRDGKPVPPRRKQAIDESAGEVLKPNPDSAAVWHYTGLDGNGDGRFDFEETMHRTLGMVAIKGGLLVIADMSGLIHCLDAKTGRLHWTHDTLAAVWASPLLADGKIFIGDEDGEMCVFELSPEQNLLAENYMGSSIYSSAVAVDNVLYVATRTHLIAIGKK